MCWVCCPICPRNRGEDFTTREICSMIIFFIIFSHIMLILENYAQGVYSKNQSCPVNFEVDQFIQTIICTYTTMVNTLNFR